jgi:hypothetical protein
VTKIKAHDPDLGPNSDLLYSIKSRNDSNIFNIVSRTGETLSWWISLIGGKDRKRISGYFLSVQNILCFDRPVWKYHKWNLTGEIVVVQRMTIQEMNSKYFLEVAVSDKGLPKSLTSYRKLFIVVSLRNTTTSTISHEKQDYSIAIAITVVVVTIVLAATIIITIIVSISNSFPVLSFFEQQQFHLFC